jgi:hypothetical protein
MHDLQTLEANVHITLGRSLSDRLCTLSCAEMYFGNRCEVYGRKCAEEAICHGHVVRSIKYFAVKPLLV